MRMTIYAEKTQKRIGERSLPYVVDRSTGTGRCVLRGWSLESRERHSRETKSRVEAMETLRELDAEMAVRHRLADASILGQLLDLLDLEKGIKLYLDHAQRPRFMGGASKATAKPLCCAHRRGLRSMRGTPTLPVRAAGRCWCR